MKQIRLQIRNFIRIFIYFLLLFLGILGVSWLIWSRFIRKRLPRDIPDLLLTEYRFWILLYICLIYIYIIKSLVKPNKFPSILGNLSNNVGEIIYKPFITLDNAIKHKLFKDKYYNFTLFIANNLIVKSSYKPFIIFSFIFLPRFIMILFLCLDIFCFHHIAIFYNFILLGLFPLIYRYLKFSIKSIYEYHVNLLDEKYDEIRIFQVNFEDDDGKSENDIDNPKSTAEFHNLEVSIKEYIEIKHDTDLDWAFDRIHPRYEGKPYARDHIYINFRENKYPLINGKRQFLTWTDLQEIHALYYTLIKGILNIKRFIEDLSAWDQNKKIRYTKAIIYVLYLICWSYVLIRSYYATQIDLMAFKSLIKLFMSNLCKYENPF